MAKIKVIAEYSPFFYRENPGVKTIIVKRKVKDKGKSERG